MRMRIITLAALPLGLLLSLGAWGQTGSSSGPAGSHSKSSAPASSAPRRRRPVRHHNPSELSPGGISSPNESADSHNPDPQRGKSENQSR